MRMLKSTLTKAAKLWEKVNQLLSTLKNIFRMNSTNFLKEKLNSISKYFPEIEIRYEFRENISTHIIEIRPLELFRNNTEYIDAEIKLEQDFSSIFPMEEILFVSEDSLTQIKSPTLKLGNRFFNYNLSFINPVFLANSFDNKRGLNENNYSLAA